MSEFRFKRFGMGNDRAALKIGTDAVLLGASMTLEGEHFLDIGTGTGVIAAMAAQRLSDMQVPFSIDAIDIDGPSAEEAAESFSRLPWASALKAVHCPLSSFEPAVLYDGIFSNPPYYDCSLPNPDEREAAARHSGSLSYGDICAFAAKRLREGGRLSLILPSEYLTALRRTASSFDLTAERIVYVRTTSAKQPRRVIAEFVKGWRGAAREESLTMMSVGTRTPEYDALVSPFLLD